VTALNTPEHRERFDAGARVHWRMAGPFSLPVQAHIVHEGGQLHQLHVGAAEWHPVSRGSRLRGSWNHPDVRSRAGRADRGVVRSHRVERDYEYSYRVLGIVRARAAEMTGMTGQYLNTTPNDMVQ
jgi:hypothetical protein